MKLIKTKNWEEFCFFHENRVQLTRSKFNALKKSIKDCGYIISPILVMPTNRETLLNDLDGNETSCGQHKYAVIDGQNRLLACKELDVEAVVVINDNIKRDDLVIANNTSSPWTPEDYMKYYHKRGNHIYTRLLNIWKEYRLQGFTTSAVVETFYEPYTDALGGPAKALKNGTYNMDAVFGGKVLDTCLLIEEVDENLYKNTKFVRTIRKIMKEFPKFNMDRIYGLIEDGLQIEMFNDENKSKTLIYELYDSTFPILEDRKIPREMKDRVFVRDGNKCSIDGCDGIPLQVDHKQPWSKHGKTELNNLTLLCETHNKRKGNLDISL